MAGIPLPQTPAYSEKEAHDGTFVISGCYPGYGMTLGNAVRRVLLSSLEGAAIVSIKIKGVTHEFSTVEHIAEDVVQIILNLKKIRFELSGEDTATVQLSVKGEKNVTAADITTPSSVRVVNTDQAIATLTDKKAALEMEMTVQKGLGYVPVEQQERGEKEIGAIAIDAVYTPIKRVNYAIENMRVGKRTDYEKITLDIVTDGSMTPQDAFTKAITILVEQFSALGSITHPEQEGEADDTKEATDDTKETKEDGAQSDEAFEGLSTRTLNALNANDVTTVAQLSAMSEEELDELGGMGAKGITEIKKMLKKSGLSLKE